MYGIVLLTFLCPFFSCLFPLFAFFLFLFQAFLFLARRFSDAPAFLFRSSAFLLALRTLGFLFLPVLVLSLLHGFIERYFAEQVLQVDGVAAAYLGLVACRGAGVTSNGAVSPGELRTPGDVLDMKPLQGRWHPGVEGGHESFVVLICPNPFVSREDAVENLSRPDHAQFADFEPRIVFADQSRSECFRFCGVRKKALVAQTVHPDYGKHGVHPCCIQALAGAGCIRHVEELERIVLDTAVAPV